MRQSRTRLMVRMASSLLGVLALAACQQSGGGGRGGGQGTSMDYAPLSAANEMPPPGSPQTAVPPRLQPRAEQRAEQASAPASEPQPSRPVVPGNAARVTWEALQVERDRFENPSWARQRPGRRPPRGVLHRSKIVVVNESHPEAQGKLCGKVAAENLGVSVAVLSDKEMDLFIRGVQQRGFFRLARPTGSMQALFDDCNARGRVTIERGNESYTLVSMRGQGLNPATKMIPAMYSEMKQAILMLRNRTPTMSIVGASRDPLRR